MNIVAVIAVIVLLRGVAVYRCGCVLERNLADCLSEGGRSRQSKFVSALYILPSAEFLAIWALGQLVETNNAAIVITTMGAWITTVIVFLSIAKDKMERRCEQETDF